MRCTEVVVLRSFPLFQLSPSIPTPPWPQFACPVSWNTQTKHQHHEYFCTQQSDICLAQLLTQIMILSHKLGPGIWYRSKYQLQSVRNNGTNVGILQSLHQVDPTKVHTETERTPQASLSWPIESIWGWSWQSPGSHYYQWQDVVSLPWAAWRGTCEIPLKEMVQDTSLGE